MSFIDIYIYVSDSGVDGGIEVSIENTEIKVSKDRLENATTGEYARTAISDIVGALNNAAKKRNSLAS